SSHAPPKLLRWDSALMDDTGSSSVERHQTDIVKIACRARIAAVNDGFQCVIAAAGYHYAGVRLRNVIGERTRVPIVASGDQRTVQIQIKYPMRTKGRSLN